MKRSPGDEGADRLLAGRYRLIEQLGHGGMGTVWRAHDELLDREVAVKEVTVSGLAPEERSVLHARMQQEARAAARIRHPGVITVHDVLEESGSPWIVMELIDGHSLADVLATEGTLLPRDAARIGSAVLAALDSAHRLGILHRDVKPANVLLERGGRVVLTDFGIALLDGSPGLTRTGDIVGSPDYLAPERATGHRPGPPSDLWALGATLYAAVEGESPFRRGSTLRTLQAVISDPLPEPRHAGPLAPVIEALLRKDPDARPTAGEAQRMLEGVAAGGAAPQETHPATEVVPPEGRDTAPTVVNPPPPGPPGTGPPGTGSGDTGSDSSRRKKMLVILATVLVTLLIGGLVWALTSRTGTTPVSHSDSPSPSVTRAPSQHRTEPSPNPPSPSGNSSRDSGTPPPESRNSAPPAESSQPAPETSPPTPESSAPSSEDAATTPPPAPAAPDTVVQAYFDAINAGDFRRAWNLGGKNLQPGSYDSFEKSFDQTADESVTIVSVSGDTVEIELDATQTDGTHRYFAGTYTVRDGVIVSADISSQ